MEQTRDLLAPDKDTFFVQSMSPVLHSLYNRWVRGQLLNCPLLLDQVPFFVMGGGIRPPGCKSHTSLLYLSFPKCISQVTGFLEHPEFFREEGLLGFGLLDAPTLYAISS